MRFRPGFLASNRRRGSAPAPGGDAYWANVVLRLPFDSVSPLADRSASGHLGALGGANFGFVSDPVKFGDGAVGGTTASGNGYIEYESSPDFDFADGDFTIEFWWYHWSNYAKTVFMNGATVAESGIRMRTSSTGFFVEMFLSSNGTTSENLRLAGPGGGGIAGPGFWRHIAVERSGDNYTLYSDGVVYATGVLSGALRAINPVFRLGGSTSRQFIDDFRVTKGVARYNGGSFTPPTEPYYFPDSPV